MRQRLSMLTLVVAVLLAPSLIFAASVHKFAATKAVAEDNTVTVPLNVTNEANLAAIDIPLQFSEGVTLEKVTFEGTDVEYFDLKIANIDNEKNTVVIGLLPQMSAEPKPDLGAGEHNVANLVFRVDNPSLSQITLEAIEMRNPGHFLAFVYHDYDANGVPSSRLERPEFERVTLELSAASGDQNLPTSYSLEQNYPNPFNPSTTIAFDVPKMSRVELSVFNILGQKVETLVDGQLEAGSHTVEWDASRYSSGVYFYRISVDEANFTETMKMAYVK